MTATDIVLGLGFTGHAAGLRITVSDRDRQLIEIDTIDSATHEARFTISFPNQIKIHLHDRLPQMSKTAKLQYMKLGGIMLAPKILDQVCQFAPADADQLIFVREWWSGGTVTIDLFTKDWVQFHLVYGNTITIDH